MRDSGTSLHALWASLEPSLPCSTELLAALLPSLPPENAGLTNTMLESLLALARERGALLTYGMLARACEPLL